METMTMDVRSAKARAMRKPRRADGAAKAKAARPAARGKSRHVQRAVKTQATRAPLPANDTLPEGLPGLPEEELELEPVEAAREEEDVSSEGEEALTASAPDVRDEAEAEDEEDDE